VHKNLETISADLQDVVKNWDNLPDAIKAGIMAMVKSAGVEYKRKSLFRGRLFG
jgi:hypothetical protein